jgi:oxygen-independent coproporphyrinogen-3 oxidase
LGAQTFTNNLLAYNHGAATKRMERYIQAIQDGELPIQDLYHLPLSEAMAKMISVSFYFGEIHLGAFRQRFGLELEQCFPDEIAFVLERGLMEYHGKPCVSHPQAQTSSTA